MKIHRKLQRRHFGMALGFIFIFSLLILLKTLIAIVPRRETFGILFANTSNLGDDIQTIAQLQYIPKNAKRIIVDREQLHQVTTPCRVIMNGWFMHNTNHWPPSDFVDPIYVAFHVDKKELLSTEQSIAHFKRNHPIGCRDLHTMKLLQTKGVDAYFSACLTLTLQNPHIHPERKKIYIVDAHLSSKQTYPWGSDVLLNALIPKHIRDQAEYIEHEIPEHLDRTDMHKRHAYVQQNLLRKYADAKLVITSRLHCALPCVAYNTPCIVLFNGLHTDSRYTGLTSYFHGYSSVDDTVSIDFDNPTTKLSKEELLVLQTNIRSLVYQKIRVKK